MAAVVMVVVVMMMVMLACRSVLGAIAGPYQMFAPNGTNNPLIPISETVVVLFERGFNVLFPFLLFPFQELLSSMTIWCSFPLCLSERVYLDLLLLIGRVDEISSPCP